MEQTSSLKVRVQKLGTSLSNMVMPNIGAFIAWGVLTSLFIETGWPRLPMFLPIVILQMTRASNYKKI